LEVKNQFKVKYKYLISKTNDGRVYHLEVYSGKKKIDDLSLCAYQICHQNKPMIRIMEISA